MNTFQKEINEDTFSKLFKNKKTIEIGINCEPEILTNIQVNDSILYNSVKAEGAINCKVLRIQIYPSMSKLLELENKDSFFSTIEESGINSSTESLSKMTNPNGFFIIEIEPQYLTVTGEVE